VKFFLIFFFFFFLTSKLNPYNINRSNHGALAKLAVGSMAHTFLLRYDIDQSLWI
jgi:hypothetical protein